MGVIDMGVELEFEITKFTNFRGINTVVGNCNEIKKAILSIMVGFFLLKIILNNSSESVLPTPCKMLPYRDLKNNKKMAKSYRF